MENMTPIMQISYCLLLMGTGYMLRIAQEILRGDWND